MESKAGRDLELELSCFVVVEGIDIVVTVLIEGTWILLWGFGLDFFGGIMVPSEIFAFGIC